MCRLKERRIMMNAATMTKPRFEIKVNPQLMNIKWGDVVYVDFGDGVGSEQGGIRPAIVIQNNKGNSASPCTVVAPMTSSESKNSIPTHITVYPTRDSGLKKISIIMCEQIRAIDKTRILSKVGHLECDTLANRIENAIDIAFDRNFA